MEESMNDSFNFLEAVYKASEKMPFSEVGVDGKTDKADKCTNLQGKISHSLKSDSSLSIHEDTISEFEGSQACTSIIRKRPLLYSVKSVSMLSNKKIEKAAVNVDDILLDAKVLEVSNHKAPNMKEKQFDVKATVQLVPFTSLQSIDQVDCNYEKNISQNTFLQLDTTSETYISDGISNVQINDSEIFTEQRCKDKYSIENWNAPKEIQGTSVENSVPSLFISDTQIFQIGDEVESLINALRSSTCNFDDNCFLSQQITVEVNNRSHTEKSEDKVYFNGKNISQESASVNTQNCNRSLLKCQVSSKQHNNISESKAKNLIISSLPCNCGVSLYRTDQKQNCTKICRTAPMINMYNENNDKYTDTPDIHHEIDEKYSKSEITVSLSQSKVENSKNSKLKHVDKKINLKKSTNLLDSEDMNKYNISINEESDFNKTPVIYTDGKNKDNFPKDYFCKTLNSDDCTDRTPVSRYFCVACMGNINASEELFIESKCVCNEKNVTEKCQDTKYIHAVNCKNISVLGAVNSKPKLVCNDVKLIEKMPNKKCICNVNRNDTRISDHSLINDFQIARGKQVSVCRESLTKAKRLFHDQDTVQVASVPKSLLNASGKHLKSVSEKSQTKIKMLNGVDMIEKESVTTNFQTARGMQINVSKESLAKVNILLNDDLVEKSTCTKAASGKTISTYKESIAKEKTLFKDVNVFEEEPAAKNFQMTSNNQISVFEETLVKPKVFSDMVEKETVAKGFCNGKQIIVSKESLATVKMLLKDGNMLEEEPAAKGFQRASVKQVSGFDESLAKTNMLFSDDNAVEKKPVAKGFQMVSDNQITVSEKTLEKPKMFNDNTKHEKEPLAKGFHTASGKQVSVSEKSLAKVKTIFSDGNMVENETIAKGFCTATGKQITISEDSLAKVKMLFKNDKMVEEEPAAKGFQRVSVKQVSGFGKSFAKTNILCSDNNAVEKKPVAKGFQMVSDNQISVSEETLVKPKMFNDNNKHEKEPLAKGFHTASGKQVSVSEKSLAKVKTVFRDGNMVEKETVAKGFCTASGKQITISEESLAKVKMLFKDDNMLEEEPVTKGFQRASVKQVSGFGKSFAKTSMLFSDDNAVEKKPVAKGFQMVSDNQISVSEETLVKPKMFNDNNKHEKEPIAKGFHTASGKQVSVSEKSLAKVKTVFSDGNMVEKETVAKGFCTASGKQITISEESLAKVKMLFKDDNMLEEDPATKGFQRASVKQVSGFSKSFAKTSMLFSDDNAVEKKPVAKGFQMVSDNQISVPKETLVKPKMFNNNNKHEKEPIAKGFYTASGKQVSVSEKSLAKVKTVFSDGNMVEKETVAKGFCTASGKQITISEESLAKVKMLFKDDNMLEEEPVTKGFQRASVKQVSGFGKSFAKTSMLFSDDNAVEKKPVAKGFQMVSDNQISVSEETLVKPKMFNDNNKHEKEPIAKGFHTASGKQVSVSEKSLAKVKTVFSDGNMVEKETVAKGFCTASGKQITISEESLAKVKMLFKDDNMLEEEPVTKGFQRASVKQVSGFGKSFAKTSMLFSDDNAVEKKPVAKGFQMVSDNQISVPKETLVKPKMFNNNNKHEKEPIAKGFYTASGKQVSVSEKSLAKVKTVFSDGNMVEKETVAKGFCTASGKQITISEESLAKVKMLIKDDNMLEEEPVTKGFQRASVKHVSGFDKSLANTNMLFSDGNMVHKKPVTIGFNTASGKQVSVSEISLAEANIFFSDEVVGKTPVSEENYRDSLTKRKYLFYDEAVRQKAPIINSFPDISVNESSVSEESLATTKLLFDEDIAIEKEPDSEGFLKQFKTSDQLKHLKVVLCGENEVNSKEFQTERRGQVSVPEESVAKMNGEFNNKNVVEKERTTYNLLADTKNQINILEELDDKTELLFNGVNISFLGKKSSFIGDSSKYVSENLPFQKRFLVNSTNLAISPQLATSESFSDKSQNTTATLFGVNGDLDTSLSLVHEVSEITAAFVADEEISSSLDAPDWLKMYVTSPSIIQDRLPEYSSVVCYENEVSNIKQASPLLGSSDRYVKKNSLTNNRKESQNLCELRHTNTSRFRPPFNTSTPIDDNSKNLTNKRKFNSFYAPFSKRQKLFSKSSTDTGNHNVIEMRQKAAEQQKNLVEYGKQCTSIIHCKGSYLLRKQTESGIPLLAFVRGQPPKQMPIHKILMLGIKKSVTEVTSDNAVNFRFSASDYYSHDAYSKNINGIPVGDGALLIFDSNHTAGVEEVSKCFLSSPGIDPSRISSQWIRNHYRWIILKMACTERSYPYIFGNRYLTPNNLLLQLKYRYDREVNQGQRPALKKILEKDESAAKPVVLFVSSIISVECNEGSVKYELELSDGWYSITASIDHEMATLVFRKVFVGTKLILCGAELLNCDDGCDPLYVSKSVRLKISTNSVRRVRWHTRLGFCNILPNIPGHICSILPQGGNIYSLTACIPRIYPLLYIEKQLDGKTIIRSERAEFKESELHQQRKEELVDNICLQVQKELEQESHKFVQQSRTLLKQDISRSTNPEELCAFVESTPEPLAMQILLSEEQMKLITEYRQSRTDHMHEQMQDRIQKQLNEKLVPRIVTPLLKIRLMEPNRPENRNAILSVWRPSEEIVNLVKEGALLKFHNITACGRNRNGELLLSVTPQTRYELLRQSTDVFSGRSVVQFDSCTSQFAPLFSEVDIVGIVIEVNAVHSSSSQIVYIADAEFNLFAITFWDGLKSFCCDDLLVPSAVIAASNLQWCQGTVSWNIPCAYAKEISSFTTAPRQIHLKRALQALKSQLKIKDGNQYISKCVEKLHTLLNVRNTGGIISYSNKTHNYNSSLPGHYNSGIVSSHQSLNQSKVHECNSKQLLQHPNKKLHPLKEKMCKLEKYGEPPSLTPFATVVSSNLKKEFRSPVPNIPVSKN